MSVCAEGDAIDHKCDYCGKESFGGVHADGSVIDHKCDYCGAGLFGAHAEGDVMDHKCDYCGGTMSVCVDGDKNHLCDICGVDLGECADENKNGACDVCGDMMKDKTGILILLMLMIVLVVMFCTGTIYYLAYSKKTARAHVEKRATKPEPTVAKKTVASVPVVALRAVMLLPQPDSPTTPTISPVPTEKET